MEPTDDDVREFQAIWREEFGEELNANDARREAALLLELYVELAEPLPTEPQDPFAVPDYSDLI